MSEELKALTVYRVCDEFEVYRNIPHGHIDEDWLLRAKLGLDIVMVQKWNDAIPEVEMLVIWLGMADWVNNDTNAT